VRYYLVNFVNSPDKENYILSVKALNEINFLRLFADFNPCPVRTRIFFPFLCLLFFKEIQSREWFSVVINKEWQKIRSKKY